MNIKVDAVKQVTEHGQRVGGGVVTHRHYPWLKAYGPHSWAYQAERDKEIEIRRLKAELKLVTGGRDDLESRGVLRNAPRVRYAFIALHKEVYPVRQLCQVLEVHHSGYYPWSQPLRSASVRDKQCLLGLIKQFWLESGGVYGYCRIHDDLRGQRGVYCLMRSAGLQAQVGYGQRRPRDKAGPASVVAPNRLWQQINVSSPVKARVTGIIFVRTHECWLFLTIVLDLFVLTMNHWLVDATRMGRDLVLRVLVMALWRRKPEGKVIIHSGQCSQYTGHSHECQSFIKVHNLECSMSRRGNCHDNAVAESFFQLLKPERIKRIICATRDEARSDIFGYIEMFYKTKRWRGCNNQLSLGEFEKQYFMRLQSV